MGATFVDEQAAAAPEASAEKPAAPPAQPAAESTGLPEEPVKAIRSGDEAALLEYLTSGADLNARQRTPAGRGMLGWAALSRQAGCMKLLIDHGADVNVSDCSGMTPLNYVVCYGEDENRLEEVRMLIDAGADLNKSDNRRFTPCIHGAIRGRAGAVEALLRAGADYDRTNEMGHEAEAHARAAGHEDIACLIADVRAAGSWAAYEAAPPRAE